MVVVYRVRGFRFVIYTLDHTPAHIHVTGAGQAKVNLLGPGDAPELIYSVDIGRADMRRLMAEVVEHRERLWRSGEGFMDVPTDAQLDAAEARGREMHDQQPRASAARFDPATARVVIDLTNGCSYAFPAKLVEDLQGAGDDDLADVQVDGVGFNLHWPRLDVDLLVPALVSGVFGTRAWMARELARRAGQATSIAKATASRSNGAKGGRPRKRA